MKTVKNNILKAVLGVAVISSPAMFTSCDDFLDLAPQGTFTEELLDSTSIEGLLTSAYAGLECHFFGNNESFQGPITNWIFDVRSDDAYKGGGALSMEAAIHDLEVSNFTSDNVCIRDKWRNNYYAIDRVHKAMRAIEEAPDTPGAASMLGELKTLRAYFYFDLIRVFKNIAYFDETVSDPSSVSPYQYSRDEIFSFIKKDLIEAYDVLPESQEDAGRFNKYVAAALMAKVSAFTADWKDVITYSGYVIGSNKYQLYNNFLDMSKVEFDNKYESILAIQFSVTSDRAHYNYNNILNTTYSEGNLYGQGDDFFLGSQNLVNAFRTDENGLPYLNGNSGSGDNDNSVNVTSADYAGNVDPRLDFTVGRIGMPFRGHTYNQNWCRAYDLYGEYSGKKGLLAPEDPNIQLGFSPWGASGLNFCLIRYADIVLLRAEALIETWQNPEEARQLINSVREKARRSIDSNYTPTDLNPMIARYKVEDYPAEGWEQDYARRAVRMERRLELAMEGNRWFDLVRWGTVVDVVNNYMQNESSLRTYYKGYSITDNEIYFPVPLEEVDNSNGGYDEPQN